MVFKKIALKSLIFITGLLTAVGLHTGSDYSNNLKQDMQILKQENVEITRAYEDLKDNYIILTEEQYMQSLQKITEGKIILTKEEFKQSLRQMTEGKIVLTEEEFKQSLQQMTEGKIVLTKEEYTQKIEKYQNKMLDLIKEKYELVKGQIKSNNNYVELNTKFSELILEKDELLKKNRELSDLIAESDSTAETTKRQTELSKKYIELYEGYKKLLEAVAEEGNKTQIVNKTDTKNLELIIFSQTSDKIKNDYSNQQAIYSKYCAEDRDTPSKEQTGNGIFITDRCLLTNHHLFADNFGKDSERDFYAIIPSEPEGNVFFLKIVAYNKSSDLALFQIVTAEGKIPNFEQTQKFKESYGIKNINLSTSTSNLTFKYLPTEPSWMQETLDKKTFPVTTVEVKNVERQTKPILLKSGGGLVIKIDDPYLTTKDFIAEQGMSGSPLYDSSGNLAGIIVGKKEGTTLATSSDAIFSFLQDCIYEMKD